MLVIDEKREMRDVGQLSNPILDNDRLYDNIKKLETALSALQHDYSKESVMTAFSLYSSVHYEFLHYYKDEMAGYDLRKVWRFWFWKIGGKLPSLAEKYFLKQPKQLEHNTEKLIQLAKSHLKTNVSDIEGDRMDKIQRINSLLDECKDFRITLSSNAVWRMNPGVDAPDFIDSNSAKWRTFKNTILWLDRLIGTSGIIEQMKKKVETVYQIDDNFIEDLIVDLNELKMELEIKTVQANSSGEHNEKSLIEKAGLIESITDGDGMTMDTDNRKVFIVHGHDDIAKMEAAYFLSRAGFTPIILHEQPSAGKTIIEKIEEYTDVCYGIVLYTECDLGHAKDEKDEHPRARQNVVFEHGYLIAKLGRSRVTALVKGKVETPGDISGVVYTEMDVAGAWKNELANNMLKVGIPFDKTKI